AQSMCAHPKGDFARVWMHNEMLQVEGKKMSKSLGNFFTVRDLMDKGVPGEVIRFVFLSTHYSNPMDWTEEKAKQAMATLRKWRGIVTGVNLDEPDTRVVTALADDLNTAGAIAVLHELANSGNAQRLASSAALMGLLTNELSDWPEQDEMSEQVRAKIEKLARRWIEYRRNKNWAAADSIRDKLLSAGVRLEVDATNNSVWRYENPDMMSADERAVRVEELAAIEALK
ncbi:MAG: DALR domain-containing protein, partial [Albidovulum sp.]